MKPGACIVWLLSAGLCLGDSVAEALKSRRFQDALALTEARLSSQPHDAKLLSARGIALKELGRDAESILSFETALGSSPRLITALQGAVEVSYRSRDPRAAVFLARLLAVEPENPVAQAMAGVLAFEAGDCRLAVQHFERSRAVLISNEQAYPLYGACLLTMHRFPDAVGVFERLLAAHPDSVNMRFNLAYAQLLAQKPADAINTIQLLADKPGAAADLLNLLASAEAAAGRLDSALVHLRNTADIAPRDEQNYVDLAAICIEQGAMGVAAEIVDAGLKNVPDSARLHSVRGVIRAHLGQYEDAAWDFDRANRLDPKQQFGAAGLGVLYTETSHEDLASAVLRDRLKKTPDDFMLNYLFAQALMREALMHDGVGFGNSQLAEARQALMTSIRSKPDFTRAHTSIGKLYAQLGENEKAAAELKVAVAQDRGDRTALNQLAIVLRRLGRNDEAAEVIADLKRLVVKESQPQVERKRLRVVTDVN